MSLKRRHEKWSNGDRIAAIGVAVAVVGVIAAALAIPGIPKIFPWGSSEETHTPPAQNPALKSIQAPSIDLSPGYVSYDGLSTDWDADPPMATRGYKVGFTLTNVGLSSAIDIRTAMSCNAYAWQESPKLEALPQPKSPGSTLASGASHKITAPVREYYRWGDNRPSPKELLCDAQVWYQDVTEVAYHEEFCLKSDSIPDKSSTEEELTLCPLTKLNAR